MLRWILATGAVVACASSFLTAAVMLQDEQGGQQMSEEMQAQMEAWMKLSQPGEEHAQLEPFAGEWKTTMRVWMDPSAPPTESEGTTSSKWVLGKRFLLSEYEGQFMDMPMQGIGLMGYDKVRNLYTSMWIDNMGTQIFTSKGTRTPDGVITLYGEMDEPGMSMYGRIVKFQHKVENKDRFVMTCYDLAAGDDYKAFEIVYERK